MDDLLLPQELQAELAVLEKKPIRLASTSTLSLDSQEARVGIKYGVWPISLV